MLPFLGLSQTQIGVDINGKFANDLFGISVSLSADGNIVAIGALYNDDNGTDSGQVRIFKNNLGIWTQIGSDINGEAANDYSGYSVSISSDGSIVAIGAFENDGRAYNSGQVRVYKNLAGTWTQIGADINGEAYDDFSGYSVSLSADGNKVAIGAPYNDGNGLDSGQVRIYQNIAETWTQIGTDINGEASGDLSGYSVSLSSDGNIVAIGALTNDENGNNSGHVRIYQNISGTWTRIGLDIDGKSIGDNSGNSVSLSADGSKVAIGAQSNDGNGIDSGQVRVFQNTAGSWTQIGNDIEGEIAGDLAGYSVSLSGDGTKVAIGSFNNDGNGTNSGQARIFKNKGGTWVQTGSDIIGEAANDRSGNSVSISSNGTSVAIGAEYNDGNGTDSGQVRVYDLSALLASDSFILSRFSIYTNPVTQMVIISLHDNLTLEKVNIYNTLGQLIKTEKQNKINVSTLSKGSYFVEIITTTGKATKTIMVE